MRDDPVSPGEAGTEPPLPRVSLHAEKISIQTATMKICEQAGLTYEWRRSYDNTQPDCRRYIRVDLADMSPEQALDEVVTKNGLAYRIEGNKVWLER